MYPDSRKRYLNELGLTHWQARGDVERIATSTVMTPEPSEPEAQSRATVALTSMPASAPAKSTSHASDIAQLDWLQLEAALAQTDHRGASRPVFGVGAQDAPLLIIGEAPGAQEDEQGEPFVGRAGKLLDRMLFAIGHDRKRNTYITNICKFRPPDNRDPKAEEVAADWPFLERQIALLQPRLIVAVGRVAAQTLLGSTENLAKMRGHLHPFDGASAAVLVTYHPAYLLRSPQHKAKSWVDLKGVAKLLRDSKP